MSRGSLSAPGWLRGWWWRSSQLQRLVVSGVATAVGLALSGAALFAPSGRPALFDGATSTTEPQLGTTTTDTAIPVVPTTPDDAVITVTTVSTVARFEGVDTTTGHAVAVRVLGILPMTGCWSAESTAEANKALAGKRVWLVHAAGGQPDVTAQVLLPDRHDYALTMVRAGAARADTGQAALVAAQADSQHARRGLWGSSCAPAPDAGSTTGQTTTSGATTTTSPARSTTSTPPTTTTSGTGPPVTTTSGDGPVRVGQPCSPEGATGVTVQGQPVICVRGAGGNDRWRKS